MVKVASQVSKVNVRPLPSSGNNREWQMSFGCHSDKETGMMK